MFSMEKLKFKTTIEMDTYDENGNPTGKKWRAEIDENTKFNPETGQFILSKKDFKEVK